MEPDGVEIRVLGCLIEKQRTTPDAYPLSLNALRLACNQSTNRDPVVAYEEEDVTAALRRLAQRGWTRLASGAGSRARKYRHLLPEALGLDDAEISLLAVLMLRGPQTPGELKGRSERLHAFADLDEVGATVERLVERGWVARQERRPGRKEVRYEQLLGGGAEAEAGAPAPAADPADREVAVDHGMDGESQPRGEGEAVAAPIEPIHERLGRLEAELAGLRDELSKLREALGD